MCALFNPRSSPPPNTRIDVPLKHARYTVHVQGGLIERIGDILRPLRLGKRCAIVTDDCVGPLHAERLAASLEYAGYDTAMAVVPAGEPSKSMQCASQVCEDLIAARLDRGSFLLALGGGVVGDLAGFVAAIYYRGIPFVQVPTTVMAQVDSSVGGKTGVNAASGKNLIGAFHQPATVIADLDTLATLPPRAFREGFAEVIKHAIIRDASMLDLLEDPENLDLARIIPLNIEIKAGIVCADEKETLGIRALLNFGHTIGHAIEQAAGYGVLLHGEAISLGLIAACHLSEQLAGFPAGDTQRIVALLRKFQLPTQLPADLSLERIEQALQLDKKFSNGRIRFVLSAKPGQAFLSPDVTSDHIREAIAFLRQHHEPTQQTTH